MAIIQSIFQGAMRGLVKGALLGLTSLAFGILYERRRRTRDWVRKTPLQRALLLLFSAIWALGVVAICAFVVFILFLIVLSCFS